jgi:hypothetical protein
MAKQWIAGAIKHPGQLHRDLHVPQGQKIPAEALQRALSGSMGPTVKKRAQLARTLGKMHH